MPQSKDEFLGNAKNIAVIGCSEKAFRTSYQIAEYLQENGFNVIPINPKYDHILGQQAYPTLQDVPDDIVIDIADIFRRKEFTADMVDQVVERSAQSGNDIVVWTQLDVSSGEAKEKAEAAGLTYIENECIMVEHQRLFGK